MTNPFVMKNYGIPIFPGAAWITQTSSTANTPSTAKQQPIL
jgi:hypothetical protein